MIKSMQIAKVAGWAGVGGVRKGCCYSPLSARSCRPLNPPACLKPLKSKCPNGQPVQTR